MGNMIIKITFLKYTIESSVPAAFQWLRQQFSDFLTPNGAGCANELFIF
jgi:hypothetical protein